MDKYILVTWPESQHLMDKPWFNECLLVQDIEGHEEVGSSSYMVPENRYEELNSKHIYIAEHVGSFINNSLVERVLGIYINKEDAVLEIQSDSYDFECGIENGDYPGYEDYIRDDNLGEDIIDIKSKKLSSRWCVEEFEIN